MNEKPKEKTYYYWRNKCIQKEIQIEEFIKELKEYDHKKDKEFWEKYDKLNDKVRSFFKSRSSYMEFVNELDELMNWDRDIDEEIDKLAENKFGEDLKK